MHQSYDIFLDTDEATRDSLAQVLPSYFDNAVGLSLTRDTRDDRVTPNRGSIQTVLAGGLADMTFCDPPYNVDYTGKTGKRLRIDNDALGEKFYDFLRDACTNLLAVTKGAVYICMSSSELHTLFRAFKDAGGHWSTFVIWAKHHFTLGRSDYQRQYEPILYGWREGTDHFWCGARDQGDVWSIKRPMANLEHPTMKPVELVERALRNSSKTRDTILDPFGGSGTTLIACEKAGAEAAGSVLASDAFFPFRDGLDAVAAAGATAVVQPGGSVRDADVIAAADEQGLAMVFTGRRHFRH